jgi:hypothetical protein
MKLYEVPKYSRIKVGDMELDFHHIDGMYSYCTDSEGNTHHIAAWADVEVLEPCEDEAQPMSEHSDNTQNGYEHTQTGSKTTAVAALSGSKEDI